MGTNEITAGIAQRLSQIYHTPSHPASFSTLEKLWIATDKKISKKIIKLWLLQQDTYTLHKPRRLNFKRNHYIVANIDDLWECDLAEFSIDYASNNNNVKYLLG